MPYLDQVRTLLTTTLGLGPHKLHAGSALLGSLPELDSMAVLHVITALENHFGFHIDDDDINARHFATLGSLSKFVDTKMADGA